ncbi:MAG: hypothetical protein UMV23_01905 [Halanaerobium sp.]|nr:hypothetical protein [Halanaerobium sp.]
MPSPILARRFAVNHGMGEDLEQSEELRELQHRIYSEIEDHGWQADFLLGGEEYHFHSTIVMGGQPPEVFRRTRTGWYFCDLQDTAFSS